jgi:hypothetical protein
MSSQADLHRDNPFPGMNPYLEQHWRDVHTSLMIYLRDQLQAGLPQGLWASVEEEVTIDEGESGPVQKTYPDVQVTESWAESSGFAPPIGAVTVAEPVVLLDPEPSTERSVLIFAGGGRLITAIEVLSPTNKLRYERRLAYRRKRRTYQEGDVNLVEIDLLRDGDYLVSAPVHVFQDLGVNRSAGWSDDGARFRMTASIRPLLSSSFARRVKDSS